jgi:hypothetical protein
MYSEQDNNHNLFVVKKCTDFLITFYSSADLLFLIAGSTAYGNNFSIGHGK